MDYFHFLALALPLVTASHGTQAHLAHDHLEPAWVNRKEETWLEKYGPQVDNAFSGPLSFSHLPYSKCLEDDGETFDIAILGMPVFNQQMHCNLVI
jgi:agmatinase